MLQLPHCSRINPALVVYSRCWPTQLSHGLINSSSRFYPVFTGKHRDSAFKQTTTASFKILRYIHLRSFHSIIYNIIWAMALNISNNKSIARFHKGQFSSWPKKQHPRHLCFTLARTVEGTWGVLPTMMPCEVCAVLNQETSGNVSGARWTNFKIFLIMTVVHFEITYHILKVHVLIAVHTFLYSSENDTYHNRRWKWHGILFGAFFCW